MVRRVKASHPDYTILSELAGMIASAKNPHLYNGVQDVDPLMFTVIVEALETAMDEMLEGGAFADWINSNL